MDGGTAVCRQPVGQLDFHANPIRIEKPAFGCGRYFDCLGHDYLDDGSRMEALQMGCSDTGAVFRLGVDRNRAPTFNYVLELVRNAHDFHRPKKG